MPVCVGRYADRPVDQSDDHASGLCDVAGVWHPFSIVTESAARVVLTSATLLCPAGAAATAVDRVSAAAGTTAHRTGYPAGVNTFPGTSVPE